MNRAAKYAQRLRPAPAVGVLLNDGSVVSVPRRDLKRLLPRLAGKVEHRSRTVSPVRYRATR